LITFNESLASELGVDTRGLGPDELAAVFAGNVIPPGAEPIVIRRRKENGKRSLDRTYRGVVLGR
jgi:hypothetical protein